MLLRASVLERSKLLLGRHVDGLFYLRSLTMSYWCEDCWLAWKGMLYILLYCRRRWVAFCGEIGLTVLQNMITPLIYCCTIIEWSVNI